MRRTKYRSKIMMNIISGSKSTGQTTGRNQSMMLDSQMQGMTGRTASPPKTSTHRRTSSLFGTTALTMSVASYRTNTDNITKFNINPGGDNKPVNAAPDFSMNA
jgi:hypothetical protein